MTITISSWVVPVFITAIWLVLMFRPYRRSGQYDFGGIFRLLYLIPILLTWTVYFGILLLVR